MDQSVLNWLLTQSPAIVVMGIALYLMGKAMLAKDAQIADIIQKLVECEDSKPKV